jgi:hypothetical protein
MNKMMMLKGGSPALHKLGNIGRIEDEYIRIYKEEYKYYIGNFEEGFGFVDVKFKKEDCRSLTEEERKDLNGKWYTVSGTLLYKIYVDENDNIVSGKTITKKGTIIKVTDLVGKDKHSKFIGLNVEFPEDISIGQSLILLTDKGTITTSKVTDVDLPNENIYTIYTKNSIYYIEVY